MNRFALIHLNILLILGSFVGAFKIHPPHSISTVTRRTGQEFLQITAATAATRVDDAITVDSTSWGSPPPKIVIKRFHETWEWTHLGRKYKINYRVEGPRDGQPILLTHGFGANLNHFRYNIPSLVDAGFRVYAMDLLGFGASEKPANATTVGFSIEMFSQQMVDFITSRSDKNVEDTIQAPWILAGNSIGGLCSLQVAAREPSTLPFDIASVILFNSAGGMSGFRYSDIPAVLHPLMAHVQYFVLNPRFFHGSLVYNVISQRTTIEPILKQAGIYRNVNNVDEELLRIFLEPAMDDGAKDVFLSIYGGPAGPTRESLLEAIAKKNRSTTMSRPISILALWGENDGFVPLDETVKSWATTYSGFFHLEVLGNAGHCLHDEYPEEVNARVVAFLKK
ncbi:alpha/beta fold family hydrolase [Nitzschia inconspicua]|uniref:Alpha/beta fold family hydrolase n=1 Tax=Nitzschia inconspicua TaxID=303405 RepID=A0A9K3LG67_9STRA|nr:alpha/beta fold family hydrolase [Nitzschia inconspicua]